MINNGRLRNRIDILRLINISTEIGDKEAYKTIKSVYAEIKPLRGKEVLETVINEGHATYLITTKYFKLTINNVEYELDNKSYIKYKGKYFNIVAVIDVNNRHESYEITCQEHIGNDIEVVSG